MSDVFLSYKREERTEVERLASALRRLGLQVWFDASLAAGDTFSDEIDREARSAKAIVVCWSPGAATSQWVKAEAQIGFTKQNLISTYVAGPNEFEPPLPFSSLHVEDLRAWAQHPSGRDRAWLSILRKLGKLTGRPDITAWGEVPLDYPATAAREWLEAFGADSPLAADAEAVLRESEAADRERHTLAVAAHERLERIKAEKAAAEALAQQKELQRIEASKRDNALLAHQRQLERLRAEREVEIARTEGDRQRELASAAERKRKQAERRAEFARGLDRTIGSALLNVARILALPAYFLLLAVLVYYVYRGGVFVIYNSSADWGAIVILAAVFGFVPFLYGIAKAIIVVPGVLWRKVWRLPEPDPKKHEQKNPKPLRRTRRDNFR